MTKISSGFEKLELLIYKNIVTHFATYFEQCLKAANQKRAKSPVSFFSWGFCAEEQGASTGVQNDSSLSFCLLWQPNISIVHQFYFIESGRFHQVLHRLSSIWTVTNLPWIHRFLVKKTPMHEFHLASSFLWRRRTNYVLCNISSLVVQVQLQVQLPIPRIPHVDFLKKISDPLK